MSLTHINCSIYRGKGASNDSSSYVALNPTGMPGSLVLGVSIAARPSISSQVACKLGLEHFVNGVLDFYESQKSGAIQNNSFLQKGKAESISLAVLEAAFKSANSRVYHFAHKLVAGGRMSSSLLGVVLENKVIAAGKVGPGNVFLYREKELFPFFDNQNQAGKDQETYFETLIGARSLVSVELASIPLEHDDVLLIFPFNINSEEQAEMLNLLNSGAARQDNTASLLCKHIFPDVYDIPFSACASVGPETIYLAQAV